MMNNAKSMVKGKTHISLISPLDNKDILPDLYIRPSKVTNLKMYNQNLYKQMNAKINLKKK